MLFSKLGNCLKGKKAIFARVDDLYLRVPLNALQVKYGGNNSPAIALIAGLSRMSHASFGQGYVGIADPEPPRLGRIKLANTGAGVRGDEVLPRLPEARLEADTIRKIVGGGSVLQGENATYSNIKKNLSGKNLRYLLFASHAMTGPEFSEPKPPGILISEETSSDLPVSDFYLGSDEIRQLNFRANIVILSACNTGSPDMRYGAENFNSLVESFFDGGARYVVFTHWPIVSLAAVRFTTEFVRGVEEKGLEVESAARAATEKVRKLLRSKNITDIGYWGGFSLFRRGF